MNNLDPLAFSIVTKAVDFLFDQAAKVLQSQRDDRKSIEPSNEQKTISDKNQILEAITGVNNEEIRHCLKQIETYTSNVHLLEDQIAIRGGEALASLKLVNDLRTNQDELRKRITKLKSLLEEASNQEINVPGL